jgi:prepilin-type N-terminal cleavage/methylation domain-containing protein
MMNGRPGNGGFTLVELMIVVAIIGIVTAIAIPGFSRWMKKSRSAETAGHLNKMWQGSVSYYESNHAGTVARQFPNSDGTLGLVDCCTASAAKCPGANARFNSPTWIGLQYVVPDPHFYYPTYESQGVNGAAVFTAGATGDLDCDDIRSTYARHGGVAGDGEVSGSSIPLVVNALE